MNQKYVKKIARLLKQNGVDLGNNDHQFIASLEYQVNELREQADNPNELEFEIVRKEETKELVFYGEVVEEWREINGEEVPTYPACYNGVIIRDLSKNPATEINIPLSIVSI